MPTKTLSTAKVTRQLLPTLMATGPKWDARITKYLSKETELKKAKADPLFSIQSGPIYEVGDFRMREIGCLGNFESGSMLRVVLVETPAEGHFPDLLGELCEDTSGPMGDKASAELRERFDLLRFQFAEYGLIGELPRLMGSKNRREQIRIINHMSRTVSNGDKELARRFAQMLADNIENLEPSGEL